MRPVLLRALWAGSAVGTAVVLAATSTELLDAETRVLAAGPVLGAGAGDDAVEPSSPDTSLEPVVLAAVTRAGGVDLAGGGTCPADRLTLSWTDPGSGWRSGGYVAPLGPPPTLRTAQVNGVVLCAGSHHAYVGFDAVRTSFGWDVELVPDPAGGVDDEGVDTNDPDPVPTTRRRPPVTTWAGRAAGSAIEGYARYEGQTRCDPAAKSGTLALRDLLLSRYPSTTSLGISRACGVGGRSEHKEGRAFDWGANLHESRDRAAAEDFLRRILATDSYGNRHALARRMGLMYVIWDHQIWSAYRADAGWRSYSGSSPHTDHVHVSLSWAGALGQTSFWSGAVVDGLSPVPVGPAGTATVSAHTATRRTPPASPAGEEGGSSRSGPGGTSYRDRDRDERPATVRRERRDGDGDAGRVEQTPDGDQQRQRNRDRQRDRDRDRQRDGDRQRQRDGDWQRQRDGDRQRVAVTDAQPRDDRDRYGRDRDGRDRVRQTGTTYRERDADRTRRDRSRHRRAR